MRASFRPTPHAPRPTLLLLACLTTAAPAQTPARVFTLAAAGAAPIAVFVVRDSDIFTRVGDDAGRMSSTESCAAIAGHPASVERYAALDGFLQGWVADSAKRVGDAPAGVVTTLTNDTATIAGTLTTRLHVTTGGQPSADMWVARNLLPAGIRDAGDRWRALMPVDYWRWQHGSPGFTEIAFGYGIPLRIQSPGGNTIDVTQSTVVPPWVADVDRACNAAAK